MPSASSATVKERIECHNTNIAITTGDDDAAAATYFSPERKAARFLHDRRCVDEQIGRRTLVRPEHVQLPEALGFDHLLLPRYRHRAGVELGVKVLIRRVQIDALHRGELLDV